MIKAKNNRWVNAFFSHYAEKGIRKHFHQVIIDGTVDCKNSPVLLFSNHISWWDGFWALYLNNHLFKKKFHFMMDETELKKRWLFNYSGGFSIAPDRSLFDTLDYTRELLTDSDNMVLIYPQGKLYSSHTTDVKFKRGVEKIRLSGDSKTKVYFLVQLTDYFQFKKPSLFFYLEEANTESITRGKYESAYNIFYTQCLEKQRSITV